MIGLFDKVTLRYASVSILVLIFKVIVMILTVLIAVFAGILSAITYVLYWLNNVITKILKQLYKLRGDNEHD